jgi:phosphate-selective porin OprO/OprP
LIKNTILPVALAAAATIPAPVEAATIGDGSPYSLDIGGRLMWDMDRYDDALNLANDGQARFNTQLRRARLEMSGELPGDFDWVLDVNYLDDTNDTEIHAAGLRYSGWRFANVFFGRSKEPFGLEELESSKAISLMRRNVFSDATDADSQSHYGLLLNGFAGRVGWAAGIFNPDGNPTTDDGSDRLAFTGRVFTAPIQDGNRVLHLGAAATDRNLDEAESLRGFGLRAAETGERIPSASVLADEDRQLGLEVLFLNGPLSLQSELFWRELEGADGAPDGLVDSQYLQATWTVTGETRGYRAAQGVPGMVTPTNGGAVELVARAERIELDRDGAEEQSGRIYVIGANYYPNRNVKLMFNVSHADTNGLVDPAQPDDGLAVSGRIQVAF